MPLLVHCPNRCQIRVPSNRMGKVIRCVDCHMPIWIPEVESPLLRTGNWVECRAKRAIKKTEFANAEFVEQMSVLDSTAHTDVGLPVSSSPPVDSQVTDLPLNFPRRSAKLLRAKPWRTIEPLTDVDPEDVLTPIELDDTPSPAIPTADQPKASVDPDVSEEYVQETESCQPQELSLISKLLCFVNPFTQDPRRSA